VSVCFTAKSQQARILDRGDPHRVRTLSPTERGYEPRGCWTVKPTSDGKCYGAVERKLSEHGQTNKLREYPPAVKSKMVESPSNKRCRLDPTTAATNTSSLLNRENLDPSVAAMPACPVHHPPPPVKLWSHSVSLRWLHS
jgi:hypothetical protein